jgi:hypothetical protein
MDMGKKFLVAALVLTLVLLIAACAPQVTPTPSTGVTGTTVPTLPSETATPLGGGTTGTAAPSMTETPAMLETATPTPSV